MKNLLFLLCVVMGMQLQAQTHDQNHEKYWYYRYRLINDFVKVGGGRGCSIPMNQRHLWTVFNPGDASTPATNHRPTAKWGDATITLGNYISVLATEYHLLASSGQNTDETTRELYYALRAINRLDSVAEPLYRFRKNGSFSTSPIDLNGFFVRDDIPYQFVQNNLAHFNSGKIKYRDAANNLSVPSVLNEETSDWIAVEHKDHFPGNPTLGEDSDDDDSDGVDFQYANEMSQDQIWPIFMGLSLVSKFVPDSRTYNSYTFQDGQTSLRQEAHNIMERIVFWYRDNDNFIVNPVYGRYVSLGPSIVQYLYGAGKAACYIRYPNLISEPAMPTDCFLYGSSSAPGYSVWHSIAAPVGMTTSEGYKVMQLGAIGNSYYSIIGINKTNTTISPICLAMGWYHLPLLRQILHGGDNDINESTYVNILNSAPCEGPYNFGYPNFASGYNFSVDNFLNNPERRGQNSSGVDGMNGFHGAYNGLDYMLYHNLYYILRKSDYYPRPVNMIKRHVAGVLPAALNYPSGNIGAVTTPAWIKAYERLTISATITPTLNGTAYATGNPSNTEIHFRAGEAIELKPGHIVQPGAEVRYEVKLFECGSDGAYKSLTSENSGGEQDASFYASLDPGIGSGEDYLNEIDYHYYFDKRDEVNTPLYEDWMNDSLAVKEILETGITTYPNPSAGVFTLQLSMPGGPCNIMIFDTRGRIVYTQDVDFTENLEHLIDLSQQNSGLYLLKLQSKDLGVEITKRIEKQ